ncbi:glutaredoxin family protein [Gordonia otitidis]|uniref:glutaredoxin family protein n=1 Tax=Gordonia otitidis TaxID=249058 RepID=UPI0030B813AB
MRRPTENPAGQGGALKETAAVVRAVSASHHMGSPGGVNGVNRVVLYSRPGCGPCRATSAALAKRGIDFDVVDLSVDDAARERIVSLGYQQAPVVVVGDEHWSGFRPERIKALGGGR